MIPEQISIKTLTFLKDIFRNFKTINHQPSICPQCPQCYWFWSNQELANKHTLTSAES